MTATRKWKWIEEKRRRGEEESKVGQNLRVESEKRNAQCKESRRDSLELASVKADKRDKPMAVKLKTKLLRSKCLAPLTNTNVLLAHVCLPRATACSIVCLSAVSACFF